MIQGWASACNNRLHRAAGAAGEAQDRSTDVSLSKEVE